MITIFAWELIIISNQLNYIFKFIHNSFIMAIFFKVSLELGDSFKI